MAEAFAAYGVTHFFYVPVVMSGVIKEMADLGVTSVMTHGEKAAAYMADGYARVSHKVGVCGAQAIGATNLAAGLRDAYLSRNPVLAISGGMDPESRYRFAYQEIDDMPIFDRLTKFNAMVENSSRLPDLLAQAFRSASSGMPQPVHLELPGLLGGKAMDELEHDLQFDSRFGSFPSYRVAAPSDDIQTALKAIEAAKRPILVAGGGVASSNAAVQLLAFARRHGLPVATSLNAKGMILDSDPLSVGVVGEYSATSANTAVIESDLVIYVGSLTGGLVTRNLAVPPVSANVIHIDINPDNIGRNYPNTVGLCGDAATVLQQLLDAGSQFSVPGDWLARIDVLKQEWRDLVSIQEVSDAVPMRPERLCIEISAALPDDAIVVGDTGHSGAWMAQNMPTTSTNQRMIRAHGSLGWAVPASIGAKAAAPDRPVICFAGDGGFFYHMAELETAVRHNFNVIFVVNNNASLNQESFIWEGSDRWDKHWKFAPVSFEHIAKAFGTGFVRVEKPSDMADAMQTALAANKPFIIEAVTDLNAMSIPPYLG